MHFLNLKTLIYLCHVRAGSLIAIPYCLKAILTCRNRQIRVASEVMDLSCADPQAIQERQAVIKTLTSQISFSCDIWSDGFVKCWSSSQIVIKTLTSQISFYLMNVNFIKYVVCHINVNFFKILCVFLIINYMIYYMARKCQFSQTLILLCVFFILKSWMTLDASVTDLCILSTWKLPGTKTK